MKKIIPVILLFISFSSCEKDDICSADTPTTPQVVIEFFDNINRTVPKTVKNLKIIGDGFTEGVVLNSTGTATSKYLADGVSKIKIPLNSQIDKTKFKFIYDFGNANTALVNEDLVEFNYSRNDVFISRACGYKTLFTILGTPIVTDAVNPTLQWIQAISVKQPNINDENETHIKIYF